MRLKRYPNRALFDLDRQSWVKLAQVSHAVRGGEELTVVTGKANRDCTALVLLQLLYEEAMRGRAIEAEPLLQLLRVRRTRRGAEALARLDEAIFAPKVPRKKK